MERRREAPGFILFQVKRRGQHDTILGGTGWGGEGKGRGVGSGAVLKANCGANLCQMCSVQGMQHAWSSLSASTVDIQVHTQVNQKIGGKKRT